MGNGRSSQFTRFVVAFCIAAPAALSGCGSSKSSTEEGAGTGGTTGGTGGTGATGGTAATGGKGATGGAAGMPDEGFRFALTVTYDETLTRNLSQCAQCEAEYMPDLDTAVAIFDDVSSGFSMRFEPDPSGSGYRVKANLSEASADVPAQYHGQYYEQSVFVSDEALPIADSCIDFSALELKTGGRIAGSITDCVFRGGTTAAITGSFAGTFVTP